MPNPEAFIDWENSIVTVHFYCDCEASGKLATEGGNYVRCIGCGKVYRFGGMIPVHRVFLEPDELPKDGGEWEIDYATPHRPMLERNARPPTTPDCDCCSCIRDLDTVRGWRVDPYCRYHGWAGTRPCEEHGSPGLKDQTNRMPRSIQDARSTHRTSV